MVDHSALRTSNKEGSLEDRIERITNGVLEWSGRADWVAVEDIIRSGFSSTEIIELFGVLKYRLRFTKTQWTVVNNRTVKKDATGSGNATKSMMVKAANELGLETRNHNVADALHIARYSYVYPPDSKAFGVPSV